MILNAYSLVAGFAAVLRIILGLLVIVLGARALRASRHRGRPDEDDERFYLLFLLGAALVTLAVASWPLFYLVLQSYVAIWPGIMCIQGVTRIGTGSIGAAAYLPDLVQCLLVAKPVLVFISGAWLVLHIADRRGTANALRKPMLVTLILCGVLAVADSAAEAAYLVIPKQEKKLAAGCCVTEMEASDTPYDAEQPYAAAGRPRLSATFAAAMIVTVLAITAAMGRRREPRTIHTSWLGIALVAGAISLPVSAVFLRHVAAPAFLHLPYHECSYCLVARAPESLLGIVSYVAGAFALGWAAVIRWLAGRAQIDTGALTTQLLQVARIGYLGALAMTAGKLALP